MQIASGSADITPALYLVVLCLHGENTLPGRVKSYQAFHDFKILHGFHNVSQVHYTDKKDYPVFCLSLLVIAGQYTAGMYLQSWYKICTQHGIQAPTSFENYQEFTDTLYGAYVKE